MSIKSETWQKAILSNNVSIEDAVINLNNSSLKIILVVDNNNKFEGTITDGDIRRGLLKGLNFNSPITNIIHRKALVAPSTLMVDSVKQLMITNKIQQIPVLDNDQNIIGLYVWDDLNKPVNHSNILIIMAGGLGKRLLPHTNNCPKPMLKVSGKPMLEHIIVHAKKEGFTNIVLAINYLGHLIEDYFGDGKEFGVNITYLKEKSPMGTAGALSLLTTCPKESFIITNGDVITDLSYTELLNFHDNHDAYGTMAVKLYEWEHPFGIVNTDGFNIVGHEEKPITRGYINAGIYVLKPESLKMISNINPSDMPDVFEKLRSNSKRVLAYPMHEPWLDVGKAEDLQKINDSIKKPKQKKGNI